MPAYLYAIGSAAIWALSVPLLNIGVRRLPSPPLAAALLGLLVSLLCGTLTLAAFTNPAASLGALSPGILIAGLLTFPCATGLYYLASFSFGSRTEYASQFAKAKPLYSIGIAILLLGETLSLRSIVAAGLVLTGIGFFFLGARRGEYGKLGILLGLGSAMCWAAGEAFVKISFTEGNTFRQTFAALASATLLSWAIFPIFIRRHLGIRKIRLVWLWPFAVHGILSFGIAYGLFFHSIATLGVTATVTINAFWPFASILLSRLTNGVSGHEKVSVLVWSASLIILMGSLIEILGRTMGW